MESTWNQHGIKRVQIRRWITDYCILKRRLALLKFMESSWNHHGNQHGIKRVQIRRWITHYCTLKRRLALLKFMESAWNRHGINKESSECKYDGGSLIAALLSDG